MWAHSALFGMDGLLMAFGRTHLVLLSMSRMPWDTEAEGELVVGLSLGHDATQEVLIEEVHNTAAFTWW